MESIYDFSAPLLNGRPQPLAAFRGQVLLIVNAASHCGFTPQYAGLEAMFRAYAPRKFTVLGFPCNQFGGQEPGSEAEIDQFCTENYGVSFPVFAKIDVNGAQAHPLYHFLKRKKPGALGVFTGGRILWNFTKFLVDRQGNVVRRAGPSVRPERLGKQIEALLAR
jgi:glutathione peroxidase